MNIELNSQFIFKLIKKHFWGIIIVGVVCAAAVGFFEFKTQKSGYQSSGELVQNDNNYALISSYQQFVKSKRFLNLLDKQIEKSHWRNQNEQTPYSIEVNSNNSSDSSNTPFFTIVVLSKNQQYSRYVADASMKVLITNIGKYLSGANISIVSKAAKAQKVDSITSVKKKSVYGFIVGIVLAIIAIVVNYYCIGKISDEKFIENVFNIDNFGTIGLTDKLKNKE